MWIYGGRRRLAAQTDPICKVKQIMAGKNPICAWHGAARGSVRGRREIGSHRSLRGSARGRRRSWVDQLFARLCAQQKKKLGQSTLRSSQRAEEEGPEVVSRLCTRRKKDPRWSRGSARGGRRTRGGRSSNFSLPPIWYFFPTLAFSLWLFFLLFLRFEKKNLEIRTPKLEVKRISLDKWVLIQPILLHLDLKKILKLKF